MTPLPCVQIFFPFLITQGMGCRFSECQAMKLAQQSPLREGNLIPYDVLFFRSISRLDCARLALSFHLFISNILVIVLSSPFPFFFLLSPLLFHGLTPLSRYSLKSIT
jgi:hypothetical protein